MSPALPTCCATVNGFALMETMAMSIFFDELPRLCAGVLYLALPVMAAAAVHIVILRADLFRRLKVPIDFGTTFRGRRIFGDHKTWRGAVVMVAGSAIAMAALTHWRVPGLELFDFGRA